MHLFVTSEIFGASNQIRALLLGWKAGSLTKLFYKEKGIKTTMQIFVKTLTGKAASWVFVICRKDYYSRRRVLRYDREREG